MFNFFIYKIQKGLRKNIFLLFLSIITNINEQENNNNNNNNKVKKN